VPLRLVERWIAILRLLAVPFAISQVAMTRGEYPGNREAIAWAVTATFAVGAVVLFVLTRRPLPERSWLPLGTSG
jgi:hypothetical protein